MFLFEEPDYCYSEADHVVPDQLEPPKKSAKPAQFLLPDPLAKKQATPDAGDLLESAAIEGILDLMQERVTPQLIRNAEDSMLNGNTLLQEAAQKLSKKPSSLTLLPTPDFDLLITETPEPSSPGTQEVPFLNRSPPQSIASRTGSWESTPVCSPASTRSVTPIQDLTQRHLLNHQVQDRQPCSPAQTLPISQPNQEQFAVSQLSLALQGLVRQPSPAPQPHQHYPATQPTEQIHLLQPAQLPTPPPVDQTVPLPSSSTPEPSSGTGLMDSYIHIQNMLTDFNPYSESLMGGLELEDPEDFMQGGSSGEVLEERIKYACTVLDIPMNPNSWTVEQLQKWASFVLRPYDVTLSDPDIIMALTIDGATLTAMSKEELMASFPMIGEMLYNELEVWWFGITPLSSVGNGAMTMAVEPEYCNLDNLTKVTCNDITMTSEIAPSLLPPVLAPIAPYTYGNVPTEGSLLPPLRSFMSGSFGTVKQETPDFSIKTEIPDYIKHETPMFFQDHENITLHSENSLTSMTSSPVSAFSSYSNFSPRSLSSSGGHSSPEVTSDDQESTHHPAPRPAPSRGHTGKHTIQLWMFLKELLQHPGNESAIRWLDREKGIFKIEDSAHVAKLWGRRKNRPAMNYDKLSRSIRQYYKKNIIKKTGQSKRLVYQFCPSYNS